jgi:predicted dehydrogenase
MNNNRRDFLKLSGLAAIGLAGEKLFGCTANKTGDDNQNESALTDNRSQKFNMAGYAAPKLDTVRVGNIGLGGRGTGALNRLLRIDGLEIKALCDLYQEKVDAAIQKFEPANYKPDKYYGSEDEWKKVCERNDIDLIYITTPWRLHTPMAVYAMEHGKHAVIEVPAAVTLDECWQLTETSENTRQHCMMLENCCYDFFEMLTLNMARQGFFGDIVHGEAAYIHTFSFNPANKVKTWRREENIQRNGNLYPTHGLGPICQIMDINHGDKMDYLVSVSGNDFMMKDVYDEAAREDDFWKSFAGKASKSHRGNMNTTTIKTFRGRTIMLQHDITSPNVYSRIHKVSGTKAAALKYPLPPKISIGHEWVSPEKYAELEEKYTPEITKRVGEMAKKVGGHGGMDFLMDWRLVDCLRNGLPLDMTVYDAALWSAVGPLSEWSVAHRSSPVDIPDFTCGSWKSNKPLMDINLLKGGNTKMI